MSFSTLAFLVVFIPVAFFMLVWAGVTAWRLYFPRQPLPFLDDELQRRWLLQTNERTLPVGVREIRATQREVHRRRVRRPLEYVVGDSVGVPEVWTEDLWVRRN